MPPAPHSFWERFPIGAWAPGYLAWRAGRNSHISTASSPSPSTCSQILLLLLLSSLLPGMPPRGPGTSFQGVVGSREQEEILVSCIMIWHTTRCPKHGVPISERPLQRLPPPKKK